MALSRDNLGITFPNRPITEPPLHAVMEAADKMGIDIEPPVDIPSIYEYKSTQDIMETVVSNQMGGHSDNPSMHDYE